MKTLVVAVLAAMALVLLSRTLMQRASSVARGVVERDGHAALADCPGPPNCQGSMSLDAEHKVDALPGRGSTEASLAAIDEALAALPGARIVSRDGAYLHATFTSRLMGFVDDVEFLADADGQAVQVRSASRVGHSDLGANAARIAALRAALLKR